MHTPYTYIYTFTGFSSPNFHESRRKNGFISIENSYETLSYAK